MHLQICVDRSYCDVHLLSRLIPIDPEGKVHVDEGGIGDDLAPAAVDLHAPQEPKVDPFPDPGSGVHSNLQLGRDHHRVVVHKFDLESVVKRLD